VTIENTLFLKARVKGRYQANSGIHSARALAEQSIKIRELNVTGNSSTPRNQRSAQIMAEQGMPST